MKDPECAKCIFALCTSLFFETTSIEELTKEYTLKLLMKLGLQIKHLKEASRAAGQGRKYDYTKLSKHYNDISDSKIFKSSARRDGNDRGIINCLRRETKPFCNCMKAKKTEALDMEKLGICAGCNEVFPKIEMRPCTGCYRRFYHNKACYNQHWPVHKSDCQSIQIFNKSMNNNAAINSASTEGITEAIEGIKNVLLSDKVHVEESNNMGNFVAQTSQAKLVPDEMDDGPLLKAENKNKVQDNNRTN